jgi:hypothetical protein
MSVPVFAERLPPNDASSQCALSSKVPPQKLLDHEYLSILRELRRREEAIINLLDMLRFVRSNKLKLTHVCCRRQTWIWWFSRDNPLAEEDIQEIIAEEEEIIIELESYIIDLSAKSYDDLEEIWLQELKTFAIAYIDIAVHCQEELKLSPKTIQTRRSSRVVLTD